MEKMDLPNDEQRHAMARRALKEALRKFEDNDDQISLDIHMIQYSDELAEDLASIAEIRVGPNWIN